MSNDRQYQNQQTPASREAEQENSGAGAATAGAIAGGVAGAALGPVGAVVGAVTGGALGNSVSEDDPDGEETAASAVSGRGPSEARYGDPATDADWRNSDSGITSAGATDVNVDNAILPSDQPGVRMGDADTADPRQMQDRSRSDMAGSATEAATGRDIGLMTEAEKGAPEAAENAGHSTSGPVSLTSSSSTMSLPPE